MSAIATSQSTEPLHRILRIHTRQESRHGHHRRHPVRLRARPPARQPADLFVRIPQQINGYAAFLHNPQRRAAVGSARVPAGWRWSCTSPRRCNCGCRNRAARPEAYVKKDDVPTSYAARTMIWSGPIVAAFVVFHVLHLTVGAVLPLQDLGPTAIWTYAPT